MFFTENLEHFVLYFLLQSPPLLGSSGSETETVFVCKQLQHVKPHLDPGVPHDVPDGEGVGVGQTPGWTVSDSCHQVRSEVGNHLQQETVHLSEAGHDESLGVAPLRADVLPGQLQHIRDDADSVSGSRSILPLQHCI